MCVELIGRTPAHQIFFGFKPKVGNFSYLKKQLITFRQPLSLFYSASIVNKSIQHYHFIAHKSVSNDRSNNHPSRNNHVVTITIIQIHHLHR